MCGIYTITNKIDNKIYVGYSINCFKRFSEHKSLLVNNKHKNDHLQNAWNKYGKENFVFEILEECDKVYLSSQENYWCNLLNSNDLNFGYNILPTHPYKFISSPSYKTKIKQRISAFNRKNFKEQLDKLHECRRGKKVCSKERERLIKLRIIQNYKIIDKQGNIYNTNNLSEFCRNRNIDSRNLNITFTKNVFRYNFKIISKELIKN